MRPKQNTHMALQCGIVGLPNVGKSTLFNALTAAKALAANYPFATKEPNLGVITVPDPRLDELARIVKPQRVVPTTIEILDIAGLIKGAAKGEGLGNQFLGNIRNVDAIIHVVRCFQDDNVIHVDGSVDPVRDKEVIDYELLLKDLETVEKRLAKAQKESKGGDKVALRRKEILEALKAHLEAGKPARSFDTQDKDDAKALVKELCLLTTKPVLYVCNVDEASVKSGNEFVEALAGAIKDEQAEMLIVSAAIEADIAQMEDPAERREFLEMMELEEPGVNRLIRSAYKLLDLITYFTAGEKEVRAWTVRKNTPAPQAAGVIHSDFEKGFIRAEVIKYHDFVTLGSEAACREAGKLSTEGKDYIVQDGDIMHFLFNV